MGLKASRQQRKSKEVTKENLASLFCDSQLYGYIQECAEFICCHGLDLTGILRISGNKRKIIEMYEDFCRGSSPLTKAGPEHIHVVVGAMKSLIKSLDKPLLSNWRHLLRISSMHGVYNRLSTLREFLDNMPKEQFNCLSSVFDLLLKINEQSTNNSMTTDNLAKVLTPSLCGGLSDLTAVHTLGLLQKAIKDLITHGEFFFKNGPLDEDMVLEEVSTTLAEHKTRSASRLPWPRDSHIINRFPWLPMKTSLGFVAQRYLS